jgi:uncharacterized protein with von Willebrand factor type A (vWA) domain
VPSEAIKILDSGFPMSGGGTDFGNVLKSALEMIEKPGNNSFELYHIIMMSDGESCYPT